MSSSSSTNPNTDHGWRTDSPISPPPARKPEYTVVNTVPTLQRCLDTTVKEMNMPAKSYAQAHILPRTNISYAKTTSGRDVLTSSGEAPGPLFNVPKGTPELYVDAEGINLSRSGELSILIFHVETPRFSHTYLIHVHVLGNITFSTRTSNRLHSLKTIFEDNRIPKVVFDCRMDSDALFGQFGVLLEGVIDLQLMRLATSQGGGYGLPGLELCLTHDLDIASSEQAWVSEAKAKGQRLWRPRCGGKMERFNDDPLHQDIINYCVVDAAYLPRLFETYNKQLGERVYLTALDTLWGNEQLYPKETGVFSWECRVLKESRERARCSLRKYYSGGTGRNPWYEEDYDDDPYW
ncbi:MAG: hypothetical protein Q9168_004113 [Polycauliona sp. 1 TL-2023]